MEQIHNLSVNFCVFNFFFEQFLSLFTHKIQVIFDLAKHKRRQMDLRKQSHVLFGDILMLSHFLEKQLFTVDENVGIEQIKNLDINGFIFNGMLI